MNPIDTFFVDRLNFQYRPDLIKTFDELPKRVLLEDILNLHITGIKVPRLYERFRKDTVHLDDHLKENRKLSNVHCATSESKYSKKYSITKSYSAKVQSLEKSPLDLTTNSTLRRSKRLTNKLNITITAINSHKYQPEVIISPLKAHNQSYKGGNTKSQLVNHLTKYSDINCLRVDNTNQIKRQYDSGKRTSKRILSREAKDKISLTISNESGLIYNDKSTNSHNDKKYQVINEVPHIVKDTKTKSLESQKIGRKWLDRRKKNSNLYIRRKSKSLSNNNSSVYYNTKLSKEVCEVPSLVEEKIEFNSSICNESKDIKIQGNKKNKDVNSVIQDDPALSNQRNRKSYGSKGAKKGTLKYLKERQNFLKELLTVQNTTDYQEFCGRNKNKALEDLIKIDENETLAIKTPKEKDKPKEILSGMTPRTALLSKWDKEITCPSSSTPKNISKAKLENEKGALHVLYQHLKSNASKKRKKSDWNEVVEKAGKTQIKEKTSKLLPQNDLPGLMDLDETEEEILNHLSKKPCKDLNESSFDDYFNETI